MAKNSHNTSEMTRLIGNACMNRPVLAASGSAAATVSTTNPIVYSMDGIVKQQAALSAQALTALSGTSFYTQPANTTVYYVLGMNASAQVRVVQGSYAGQQGQAGLSVTLDGSVPDCGLTPALGQMFVPFGMLKVATNGSATFVPGTTNLDATGVTVTYFDLAVLPTADKP